MADQDEYSTLDIERRGNEFVLVRTYAGARTELRLTESDVLALARLFPSYSHGLVSSKTAASQSEIEAWVAIPVKDYALNSDLHNQLVLLRLRDENEAVFDFSFEPSGARKIGERLIAWADRVDGASKSTRQ